MEFGVCNSDRDSDLNSEGNPRPPEGGGKDEVVECKRTRNCSCCTDESFEDVHCYASVNRNCYVGTAARGLGFRDCDHHSNLSCEVNETRIFIPMIIIGRRAVI